MTNDSTARQAGGTTRGGEKKNAWGVRATDLKTLDSDKGIQGNRGLFL